VDVLTKNGIKSWWDFIVLKLILTDICAANLCWKTVGMETLRGWGVGQSKKSLSFQIETPFIRQEKAIIC